MSLKCMAISISGCDILYSSARNTSKLNAGFEIQCDLHEDFRIEYYSLGCSTDGDLKRTKPGGKTSLSFLCNYRVLMLKWILEYLTSAFFF